MRLPEWRVSKWGKCTASSNLTIAAQSNETSWMDLKGGKYTHSRNLFNLTITTQYSLHRKKVYTCGKAKYSKSRGARGNVEGVSHAPLSWSKLDQASFWNSKRWRHKNKEGLVTVFVGMQPFRWMSKWGLDQFGPTPWWVWRTSYFSSSPPQFWVLGSTKVYTFFWGRLYSGTSSMNC